MNRKPTFISISLPETLKEKVEARLAESDFGNVSEYLRTLIRADLARFDYEQLIKERLESLLQNRGLEPLVEGAGRAAGFDGRTGA